MNNIDKSSIVLVEQRNPVCKAYCLDKASKIVVYGSVRIYSSGSWVLLNDSGKPECVLPKSRFEKDYKIIKDVEG